MAEVKMERSSLDTSSLPNNSLKARQQAEKAGDETRIVKPVAQGEVQKKGFGQRFLETVGVNDGRTVGDYLLWDVVVPATKDLISSIFKQGIDVFLYGKPQPRNVDRRGATSRVSYGRYYDEQPYRAQQRDYGYSPRAAFDFGDVTYKTRSEAEMVLSEMVEIADMYGFCKVSDFLQLSRVPESSIHFTDHDMGWDALGSVEVVPVRNGRWALTLPKPVRR